MSFYSPIDRLAQNLPRPKGTGAEFMTELSKMPGYKTQEAEDRGLQALANLPKMERAQFMEALKAKRPVTPSTLDTRDVGSHHHEAYTLPGGSNYREILLKHPQGGFKGIPLHFGGEPNILASIRVKDRTGPDGKKILHIEELQSDWHQQGREKGYTSPETADRIKAAERAHRELKKQLEEAKQGAAYAEANLSNPTTKRMRDLNPEMNQRLEAAKIKHNNTIMELLPQVMKAEAAHQDLLHQSRNTVPDAPFKKNWHEMALKKMIHHAAANGYDAIAITPGQEQADRYGLAEHIGMMSYNPEKQHFQAFKPNRETAISERGATPERVSQLVGKELAQKLMAAPKHMGHHYIEGDDIKVGGEGMKGFYDKIVPNFLNQFGKKYGAKVGRIQVPTDTTMDRGPEGNLMVPRHTQNYAEVHHFPITPEMREDVVKNGVPLYAEGGSVEGEEPKKTVKAYKLFRVHPKHPGKLFPLFVDANTPVEMDKWIDAKEGEMAKGKVKSKIGPLAYRPGWHAGDLPIATHIGEKSDPSLTAPDVRPENHAWAEVEMPDDVDWQAEATKRGTNAQGRVIPVKAHITDQIPKGGHYRYKTNPNMTGNWLIGGSMKVNRVLTDKEVAKINKAAGLADLPRAQPFKAKKFGFAGGGTVAPDEWKAEAYVNHMADGGPVQPLRPLNPQLAALREQMAQQSALHKAYDEATKNMYTSQMPTFAQWLASQGKAKGGLAHMATGGSASAWRNAEPHPENDLLQPIGSSKMVGDEKLLSQDDNFSHGLSEFPSNKKSYRYLYHDEDKNPIGAMQIQTAGPRSKKAVIQNLYVSENNRRQGIASKLLKRARQDFDVKHSTDLTSAGKAFATAVKAKGGSIKPVGYTKEQVTVSPNLDAMRYEMESVKRYTKKAK